MSPEQKREIATLCQEANTLWSRANGVALRLTLAREHPAAQGVREAMHYLSQAQHSLSFVLDMEGRDGTSKPA